MPHNKHIQQRCGWVQNHPLSVVYHDTEWGIPIYHDQYLFEMLILESMQAGLSWLTVLKKRAYYRQVYDQFIPDIVAQYDEKKQQQLYHDKGIIRNKLKIKASVNNAQAFVRIQSFFGSFCAYIWHFVNDIPIKNHYCNIDAIPSSTALSTHISQDMQHRGFQFVGSTILYAFMQAIGMVNNHTVDCFKYHAIDR